MKRRTLPIAIVLGLALLASCAPGPNPGAGAVEDPAGFWQGLWHGFIALFTFIVSRFRDDVGIYEVVNNGGWYDFGFILGAMAFWGGGGTGAKKKKKKWC